MGDDGQGAAEPALAQPVEARGGDGPLDLGDAAHHLDAAAAQGVGLGGDEQAARAEDGDPPEQRRHLVDVWWVDRITVRGWAM